MHSRSNNSAKAVALSDRSAVAPSFEYIAIYRTKPHLRNVNGSANVIVDPHPTTDQHQNLIVSKPSPFAHADRIWSTSV